LRALAVHGPLHKYGIYKQLKGASLASEPTIIYMVDDLERQGLIRIVYTKHKVQGSKPSRYYDLALAGLVTVIGRLGSMPKDSGEAPHYGVWVDWDEAESVWTRLSVSKQDCELTTKLIEKCRDLDEARVLFAVMQIGARRKREMIPMLDLWPEIKAAGAADTVTRALASELRPILDFYTQRRLPLSGFLPWLPRLVVRALLMPAFIHEAPLMKGYPTYRFRGTEEAKRYLKEVHSSEKLRGIVARHLLADSEHFQDHANALLSRKAAFLSIVDWMRGGNDIDLDSLSVR
jgi:hypothetical protein